MVHCLLLFLFCLCDSILETIWFHIFLVIEWRVHVTCNLTVNSIAWLLSEALCNKASLYKLILLFTTCVESGGQNEPGSVSVFVEPGHLSMGEPVCWSRCQSSSAASDVAAIHAALPRPHYHSPGVSSAVLTQHIWVIRQVQCHLSLTFINWSVI